MNAKAAEDISLEELTEMLNRAYPDLGELLAQGSVERIARGVLDDEPAESILSNVRSRNANEYVDAIMVFLTFAQTVIAVWVGKLAKDQADIARHERLNRAYEGAIERRDGVGK